MLLSLAEPHQHDRYVARAFRQYWRGAVMQAIG